MPYTVVCVFPSQQTKLDMAPSYHGGRRGAEILESVASSRGELNLFTIKLDKSAGKFNCQLRVFVLPA